MSETPTAPHNDGPESAASRRFRIAGDVVNRATAGLPDDQRSALRWLHSYASERNLSLEEIASQIKKPGGEAYSRDSVYQALTGRRSDQNASLAPLTSAIVRLRKIVEEQGTVQKVDYVHTNLSRRIWKICDAALTFNCVNFVFGESQIGKTKSLEEYARQHNHGQTIYVRMPDSGTLGDFVRWLAKSLRISPQQHNEWHLKERLVSSFDSRMVLIVDEAHQALAYSWGRGGLRTLGFIREIHDRSGCGVVIAATNVMDEMMTEGAYKKMLRQLGLRRLVTYQLPDKPTRKNLDEFADAYGLDPASGEALELQTAVIRDDGLGRWCKILQGASRVAAKSGRKLSWAAVLHAHAAICALEKGES